MPVYMLISTLIFIGIGVADKYQNIYYKFTLILLFCFTAFRDVNLGGYDTYYYQMFFNNNIPPINKFINYNHQYEIGYAFINSLIKTFSNDYRVFQIIYNIISFYLLNNVINKLNLNKKDKSLFLFIYFCYRFIWNNFVLLRQNIAVLIIWNALFLPKTKLLKKIVLIFISSIFHSSSVINLLFIIILEIANKLKKETMLKVSMSTSIILYIFSNYIYKNIINAIVIFSNQKYQMYTFNESRGINILNFSLIWTFILLFYFNFEKIKFSYKKYILDISLIAIVTMSVNTEIVMRFAEYYMIGVYLIFTLSYQIVNKKSRVIYSYGIYIVFIMILIRFLYTFYNGQLLDYNLFLTPNF